jgi:hypothetical protein
MARYSRPWEDRFMAKLTSGNETGDDHPVFNLDPILSLVHHRKGNFLTLSFWPALGGYFNERPWLRTSIAIVALAAVYFGAGKLGLSWAYIHTSTSAVWPPAGIALAALLLWGYRLWPGIFLGAFLVNITTQGSLLTTLGIAAGNTLEALVGAWAVVRFANSNELETFSSSSCSPRF